jgi:hypothetical protein
MTPADIALLKSAFSDASGWSEWCTIAVTAGVFVEFLALFVFSKEMPKSEKIVMGIATLIIVVGCGGEYVFGDRASIAAAQLQDASDQQLAALGLAAKVADGKIADAQRDAATANERTKSLEVEAGRLRLELQAAQAETKRVAGGVARHVTPEERQSLKLFLTGSGIRVRLISESAPEPIAFRDALSSALSDASVNVVEKIETSCSGCSGVQVYGTSDQTGLMLAQALQRAGIPSVSFNPNVGDTIGVRVGTNSVVP